LENSLTKDIESFKQDIRQLEKYILTKAIEWARNVYQSILNQLDDLIKEKRDKKLLQIAHNRDTWYKTYLGAIKVKRRYYRDQFGKYHYPLDELLGMEKYRHTTLHVQQLALEMASVMTFRESAEVLEKTTAISLSHQTIKNLLTRVADEYLDRKENEITHLIETGEITEGDGKKADILLMEADGVMLSLQRQKARKAEVKLGIAYEGWDKVGKDRYRTVNKTFYADIASSERFWAGFSAMLQSRYDLAGINQFVLGGDGASWIKDGLDCFGGQFQLSQYHYNKEVRRVLSNDKEALGLIREACEKGDITTVSDKLETLSKTTKGTCALEIKRLAHYLVSNAFGLKDYRLILKNSGDSMRRTGAIEGNVDKLIARRMKNQGMSWSPRGIRSMLCVRFKVLEKKLEDCLYGNAPKADIHVIEKKRVNRVIDKAIQQNYFEWFNAGLPALTGPHASRPWAKILKSLTEA
jgi:hypothetical protein